MGLIGNTCFKGTPGVLNHYSGLPMANPGGPLKVVIVFDILVLPHSAGWLQQLLFVIPETSVLKKEVLMKGSYFS